MEEIAMYDIGDLKNDPVRLYDMCIQFHQFFQVRSDEQTAEIWHVLEKVSNSLWGNLPEIITVDFRCDD